MLSTRLQKLYFCEGFTYKFYKNWLKRSTRPGCFPNGTLNRITGLQGLLNERNVFLWWLRSRIAVCNNKEIWHLTEMDLHIGDELLCRIPRIQLNGVFFIFMVAVALLSGQKSVHCSLLQTPPGIRLVFTISLHQMFYVMHSIITA